MRYKSRIREPERVTIVWLQDQLLWAIKSPYNAAAVDELRLLCQRFDGPSKAWLFQHSELDSILHMARVFWGESLIDYIPRIDDQAGFNMSNGPSGPNVFETFCKAAGLEALKKVYRAGAMGGAHPDHGGDHRRMQELNDSWAEIQRRLS